MGAKLPGSQRELIIQMLSIPSYLKLHREFSFSFSPSQCLSLMHPPDPPPTHSFILGTCLRPSPVSAIPPIHWQDLNNISIIKNCKRNTEILTSRYPGVSIQYIKFESLTVSEKTMGNMRYRMQRKSGHILPHPYHHLK